ncbi:MAG: NAD-dependent epimerase/dehydratase family protein [Candidatus Nanopelagicales bacterium]
MRILVIGGTRFVGRHLVTAAVEAGHEVTVLHRGLGCEGSRHFEHLHADRDANLDVLAGRQWDATVDVCAYWPRQVAALADALGERGGRHALISTVSAYADTPEPGMDEQAPTVAPLGLDGDTPHTEAPPIDPHNYGGLKVGCEHVAQRRYAGGLLVIRPTYIVGPHDPTARFGYWVDRLARGGQVLAPGNPQAPFQCVDARDLGRFVVGLLGAGDEGTFHVVDPEPPYSFADMLAEVGAAVAPADLELVWVPSGWLADRGVTPAMLGLWTGSDRPEFVLAMDPARAVCAGLHPRPLTDTARDTWAWLSDPSSRWAARGGLLSADREAALLSRWAAR